MQNKGVIKFFAIALTLVCIFYLSFSYGTSQAEKQIAEVAATQDEKAASHLEDSLNHPGSSVWLGFNLSECRRMQIGLGLDLKGGMNVTMQLSLPDVLKTLSDNNKEEEFLAAVEAATERNKAGDDFIDVFAEECQKAGKPLAGYFVTTKLQDKVKFNSSDDEVKAVLRTEIDNAVENMQLVLRSRIDRFGVAQPNIQVLPNKIGCVMVEMPGVQDDEGIQQLLQSSANLEFWVAYDYADGRMLLRGLCEAIDAENAAANLAEASTEAVEAVEEVAAEEEVAEAENAGDEQAPDLAAMVNNTNKEGEAEAVQTEAYALDVLGRLYNTPTPMHNGIVGLATKTDMNSIDSIFNASKAAKEYFAANKVRLLWGVAPEDNGLYTLYAIRAEEDKAPLEGDVVIDARDEFDHVSGKPIVTMKMNTEGSRKWARLTRDNKGHSIAIVLDNRVYSAPNVENEITGGSSVITGSFTTEQTSRLANVLKSGKMPAPALIIGKQVVGPSLGQESIDQGVTSFAIGIVLLFIFMILIYGFKAGMVANCALLLNAFFTLGILTSLHASLTMSGIAGLVLTLGMAVDANVLIYERTKEELRGGKRIKDAINAGYGNAFSAIFDSNLTSILTGIILFNFGTGPIRGFATTYIVGIIVSFFTAVFLTRLVYDNRMKRDKWQGLTFTTKFAEKISFGKNHNFMGRYWTSLAVFGFLALFSIAGWLVRGFGQSIDFTGGRTFTVQFENPISPESVREILPEAYPDCNSKAIATTVEGKECIRVETNYLIDKEGTEVEREVNEALFNTLKSHNLLAEGLTYETFMDPKTPEGGTIVESQMVGPSIARDITKGAIIATILALIVIFAYIWIRFRNFSFSVGAITALFFDTLLILGVYSWCHGWMPFSLDIDQTFIGAILTAIGYSINDKVVVFDRIREFLHLYPKKNKQELFNTSLNTTLARTIWTSVSTLIVLVVIFILGAASIRSFAFALILGVVIGTLTSIFVAAPVAFLVRGKKIEKEAPVVA